MADPLSDTQNAIWTVLNASTAFVALVPTTMQDNLYGSGNKSGVMRGPNKASTGPVVRIEPTGGNTHPQIDSSSSMLTQVWKIQVQLKDDRTTAGTTGLLPTKWAIYRALSQQMRTGSTIRSLTFTSKTYVKDCRLKEHQEDYQSRDKSPGEWATVWIFEVDMVFRSLDLVPA